MPDQAVLDALVSAQETIIQSVPTAFPRDSALIFQDPKLYGELWDTLEDTDSDKLLSGLKRYVPSRVSPNTLLTCMGYTTLTHVVEKASGLHGCPAQYMEAIQYLLDMGADVSVETAVHSIPGLVCMQIEMHDDGNDEARFELLELLLSQDRNLVHQRSFGWSGMMTWAVGMAPLRPRLGEFLVSQGASVRETRWVGMRNNPVTSEQGHGQNLYHSLFAAYASAPPTAKNKNRSEDLLRVLRLLIREWSDGVHEVNAHGISPLFAAVEAKVSAEALQMLLDAGADPNKTNEAGRSAFDILELSGDPAAEAVLAPLKGRPLLGACEINLDLLGPPSEWVVVGSGSFGRVYRAKYSALRQHVAVKELRPHPSETSQRACRIEFQKEIDELQGCRSRGILPFYGFAVAGDKERTLYMVTELCREALDVALAKGYAKQDPEARAVDAARQVGKGLLYLHTNGRCHCDVAARNVLISSQFGELRLADFGLACKEGDPMPRIALLWSDPEALTVSPYHRKARPSFDIWAFAVLLWEVFESGKRPYSTSPAPPSLKQLIRDIATGATRLPRPSSCPPAFWERVLSPVFSSKSKDRPDIAALLDRVSGLYPDDPQDEDAAVPLKQRFERALQREAAAAPPPVQ